MLQSQGLGSVRLHPETRHSQNGSRTSEHSRDMTRPVLSPPDSSRLQTAAKCPGVDVDSGTREPRGLREGEASEGVTFQLAL